VRGSTKSPKATELVSDEELEKLVRLAGFKCPKDPSRDPRDCDGGDCPERSDDPFEDYYDECVESLLTRAKLRRILADELRVASPVKLIKLRERLRELVESKVGRRRQAAIKSRFQHL